MSVVLNGGSGRSRRLFVGERLDYLAGPRLCAGRDMRCLVGEGEGELVAIGGSRCVVGLELGGFALEGGVQGCELRDGFPGQGENHFGGSNSRTLSAERSLNLCARQPAARGLT